MTKRYYKKPYFLRKIPKFFSLFVLLIGVFIILYVFAPLLSWEIYFAPVFASQTFASPIPKNTVLNGSSIVDLISGAGQIGVDYTNAQNWFPNYHYQKSNSQIDTYFLTIPRLGITDAIVSASDSDLSKHLVNYGGTTVPPGKGTAVVFGHSTLPQLFDVKNYKTIFANAFKIEVGDYVYVKVENSTFKYRVYDINIVSPTDGSVFEQNYNSSFLTLVTCTPPGTTWKRLVIRTQLEEN